MVERRPATEREEPPLDLDAASALRGSGWEGDLDEMRFEQPST